MRSNIDWKDKIRDLEEKLKIEKVKREGESESKGIGEIISA